MQIKNIFPVNTQAYVYLHNQIASLQMHRTTGATSLNRDNLFCSRCTKLSSKHLHILHPKSSKHRGRKTKIFLWSDQQRLHVASGAISGAFFLINVFLAVTLFLGGINGANSTTSSFMDTAILSILAAAVGAEGWAFAAAVANHGSFSAVAAVSRLSGLHGTTFTHPTATNISLHHDDVPRALDPVEDKGEFHQHDGVTTVMMKLPAQDFT
ncbi:hypothetical protein CFC21_035042 [Triticum aestivum]|uniref:Uncharacterized protein n=3 Tax=Triticum TaxID=4564 RepID=A0A9R0VKK3_TRITD|nr:hypothetical protein CFC21_035042 [Triticum aestivum]VAH59909.1 unnamed protein product [Triticum turgidum subsp. durum]